MDIIKQFKGLPEEPTQVWKDVCRETIKLHRKEASEEQIKAMCDYTWAIFRNTIKS